MAKANRVHSTPPTNTSATQSRRGFLSRTATALIAGTALNATAIAAALPAAREPLIADPVIALSERAIAAWNDFEAKCSISSKAEDLVITWKKLNPGPDYLAFHAGLSTYDPNADEAAAAKEYAAALREWGKRKRSVEKEAGYTLAERAQDEASDRFDDLRDELIEARPNSMAGLRAKARAARVSSDDGLQQQIVFDIGVLLGDLDENERDL
jgi:hypothetical protein